MPNLHAKLQPSSAKRWLACPGSVELCASVVDAGSSYADEGTAGHAVFEALLTARPVPTEVVVTDEGRKWPVSEETIALVKPCIEWADEYRQANGAAVFSEKKYEIGEGFGLKTGQLWGTADFTAFSPVELCIGDLKLGYVDVPIAHLGDDGKRRPNEQLGLYALGALDKTGWMHDRIRLVIIQPKTHSEPKEVVFTAAELEAWKEEIRPKVLTAAQGGPLVPSEEACRWCKAAGTCPALASETLALAQREMANLITLSGDEIAELLDKGTMIENAMKSVRAHAIKLLEFDPDAVPGYKRVEGEKKRVWVKPDAEVQKLSDKFHFEAFEKSLRSPAQIEACLAESLHLARLKPSEEVIKTKKRAKEIAKEMMKQYAEKPKGEATLVKTTDERPALAPVFTKEDVEIPAEGKTLDTAEVID